MSCSDSRPAAYGVAVTPSDTDDLAEPCRSLFVGGAGDVAVIGAGAPPGDAGCVLKGVAAGTVLPMQARRVLGTGTTATDIVALY